jgi:hypothetical protein
MAELLTNYLQTILAIYYAPVYLDSTRYRCIKFQSYNREVLGMA